MLSRKFSLIPRKWCCHSHICANHFTFYQLCTKHRLVLWVETFLFIRKYLLFSRSKEHIFESLNLLVFLFKSRFICQRADPCWEVTAVIRGDTFFSGLSASPFTTSYDPGSGHDSSWPLLTCVSLSCYNFVKLVVLISRLTTENSVVVRVEDDEQ